MSFFSDLREEQPGYPAPDRLYLRVDEVSSDRRDGWTVFDAVDADWADGAADARAGVLAEPGMNDEARNRVSLLAAAIHTSRRDEGAIARVELGPPDPDGRAVHFLSMFSPGIRRRVKHCEWVTGEERDRVAALGSIASLPDASRDGVEKAIALDASTHAVAVYDVGQGACGAVVGDDRPQLYFDMGAGCDVNRGTFPAALDALCFCAEPSVVLSHFHHDHWAAVAKFPDALGRPWIVPRQGPTLGFIHAVLAGSVRRYGSLLIWPRDTISIANGPIEVVRCTGTNRNDSGLAMVVHGPPDEADGRQRRVILPGDARYARIQLLPDTATSLVAAHHGGRTGSPEAEIPAPEGDAAGRLVYSYGPGNSYAHPLTVPEDRHRAVWGENDLRTATRPRDLGHVHLYWDEAAPDVAACPAHPSIGPVQR